MTRFPKSLARATALAAGSLALLSAFALTASGAYGPGAPDTTVQEQKKVAVATAATVLFPDAPYGVDPMVTGPVSAEFRARQQAAGCAAAEWPDIPATCYPD